MRWHSILFALALICSAPLALAQAGDAPGPVGGVPATLPELKIPSASDIRIELPRPVRAAQDALGLGRQRLALVVGIGTVGTQRVVDSAARDTQAVAAALRAGGFVVMLREDIGAAELRAALTEFQSRLQPGGIGFAYVTGLGAQFDGQSLLLARDTPLDAKTPAAEQAQRLRAAAVPVSELVDALMGTPESPRLLVLDASYRHPALAGLPSPGLAAPRLPPGTMALFGHALDAWQNVPAVAELPTPPPGDPRELAASRFARVLVASLLTPRISGAEALRSTRRAIVDATLGQDEPWIGGDTDAREDLAENTLLDALVPRTPEDLAREAARQGARVMSRQSGARAGEQSVAEVLQQANAQPPAPAPPPADSARAQPEPAGPGTLTNVVGGVTAAAGAVASIAGTAAMLTAAASVAEVSAAGTVLSAAASVGGQAVTMAARAGSALAGEGAATVRPAVPAAAAPAAAAPAPAPATARAPATTSGATSATTPSPMPASTPAATAAPAASPAAASVSPLTPAPAPPPAAAVAPSAPSAPAAALAAPALAAAPLPATAAAGATTASGNAAARLALTAASALAPSAADAPPRQGIAGADASRATDGRTQRTAEGGERPVFQPRINPYGYAEGDTYTYSVIDTWKGEVTGRYTTAIEAVLDDGSLLANGQQVQMDAQGRVLRAEGSDGSLSQFAPSQELWWAKPQRGQRRDVKFTETFQRADHVRGQTEFSGSSSVGRPRSIELPAGRFEVLPIESSGWWTEKLADGTRSSGQWQRTVYYSPQLGHPVAIDIEDADRLGKLLRRERVELLHAQSARAAP